VRLALEQHFGELLSHDAVLDDVGLHVDVVFGRAQGDEHRLVRGRPVLQQPDLVAYYERAADDLLLEGDLLVEDVQVSGAALQPRDDGRASLRRKRALRILELRGLHGVALVQKRGVGQGGTPGCEQHP